MRYRCNDAAASGAAASLSRGRSVSEFMPDPKPARVRIVVCAVSKHRTAAQEPRARRPDPHPIRSAPEGSTRVPVRMSRVPSSQLSRLSNGVELIYIYVLSIPCSTTVRSTLHRLIRYSVRFDLLRPGPVRFRLLRAPRLPRIERIGSRPARSLGVGRPGAGLPPRPARRRRRARARGHLQSRGGSLVRAGARESGRP
jgi:hypothetical protein